MVKWGAERGVRKKTNTMCVLSPAAAVRVDSGQPLPAVTQLEMRVLGPCTCYSMSLAPCVAAVALLFCETALC